MNSGPALLTGFPAPRARAVAQVLAKSGVEIRALVHPERHEEALAARESPALREAQLTLVDADATAIDFGLSGSEYARLTADITSVHAAHSVTDGVGSPELIEGQNVAAARELVEFAAAATRLERLVYYSSAFVSGQRSGLVREAELEAGQSFHNASERSLAIAERMLRRSSAPYVVLRAGHLFADGPLADELPLSPPIWLMGFIASAPADVPLPLPRDIDAPLALTPLDYLAELGVFAARHAPPRSTLHVIEPSRPSVRRFLELVAERSGRLLEPGLNPTTLTRLLVKNPALRALPQNVRGILEVLTAAAEYATDGLVGLAASGAPSCPTFESCIDRLLEHLRERTEHGTLHAARQSSAPFRIS